MLLAQHVQNFAIHVIILENAQIVKETDQEIIVIVQIIV